MSGKLQIYVDQMILLRRAYNQNKSTQNADNIKILRYRALMDNVNLSELERQAFIQSGGKESEANQWVEQHGIYIEEAQLTKRYIEIKKDYDKETNPDRKEKLKSDLKLVRMRVVKIGLDAYEFEDRAWLLYSGKPLEGASKENQHKLMDEATKAVNGTGGSTTNPPSTGGGAGNGGGGKVTRTNYDNRYSETYSGADMVIFFAFPGHKPIEIGVASTVSYTTYREKKQLRTVGRISSKGITKGPRTVSGRLIFTIIREHVVEMIKKEIPYLQGFKTLLMDELPPFDILVSFGNEYGGSAGLVIQAATTVDEQKTMSIEDLFTENLFTYIARGLEPMRDLNWQNTEYDPLQWFTSSWRTPGDEAIATFKPKELQLYNDAQLLPDPTPFFGNSAGWDAETFDMSGLLEDLGMGADMGDDGSGGVDNSVTPENPADLTGPDDNKLLVQVVALAGKQWEPVPGQVTVALNGNIVAKATISSWKPGGLKPFVGYEQSGTHGGQSFPIANALGNVLCAWVPKINWKKGDKLRLTYIDTSKPTRFYETEHLDTTITDDQMNLVIKTKLVGDKENAGTKIERISTFHLVAWNPSGAKTKPYYAQSHPKKSTSGKGSIYAELDRTLYDPTSILPDKAIVTVQDDLNIGLKDWPVQVYWTLDLDKCNKSSDKYKAINITNGLGSGMVALAMQEQEKSNWKGTWEMKTGANGILEIPVNAMFWTVSDKVNGKRKKLTWADMPIGARLRFHFRAFSKKETKWTGSEMYASIDMGFYR